MTTFHKLLFAQGDVIFKIKFQTLWWLELISFKYFELMRGELRGAGFVRNFQFSLEGEDQTITNYEIACKVDNTMYSAENNNF